MEKNTESLAKTRMSTIGVVAVIYSFIAAGCFGIEEAISASGPGATIIMLLLFPFIWSFPICEMVAELGSIYPTEGGVYSWGREAFGEFWGWQVGLWSGLTTWLSQAEYCALVAGFVSRLIQLDDAGVFAVKIAVVVIFTIINIIGLKSLETLETVFSVLIIAAFAIVAVVGFMNWNYNPMEPLFNPDEGLFHSFGGGVAIIIWMFCGYECMSNMAGELENPQIIPKGMRISGPVIAVSYILPTLAALAAVGQWAAWDTDAGVGVVGYADVLIQYVGNWAGVLFIIIAIISNCSIFCSYIAHGSRAFFVMADDHMFPQIMKKVDKRGIPTISIILLAIFTIITCQFDFEVLVMAATPLELYMYLLIIACVFKLRKRYPAEKRKEMGLTVMVGGKAGLWILSGCVGLVCMFALYASGTDYFLLGFIILVLGLIAYILCKWIYKGMYLDDPEAYPLNPKTKLGVGDLMDIGVYTLLSGAAALIGSIFLYFYELEYGVDYYLEQWEEGFMSNWYNMIGLCRWIGIICLIAGAIIYYIGKKSEGETVKKLKAKRHEDMNERLMEIHGFVPR